jgi:AcrR family transcriptional regulator
MATKTTDRSTARERLLAAANELFYAEGVNSVGIDRVIAHAGVAKATLYNAFGSKDELIRAYLMEWHRVRRERTTAAMARHRTPRAKLLSIFDTLGESIAMPGYRGCPFANASVEARPGSPTEEAADEHRAWIRGLFIDLVRETGAPAPEKLAQALQLVYDGASVSARMDHDTDAAAVARAAAVTILDAAAVPA